MLPLTVDETIAIAATLPGYLCQNIQAAIAEHELYSILTCTDQ